MDVLIGGAWPYATDRIDVVFCNGTSGKKRLKLDKKMIIGPSGVKMISSH